MECNLCNLYTEKSRELVCPACVRASLYPLRVDLAKTLLNKESLSKQVDESLRSTDNTRPIFRRKSSKQEKQQAANPLKHLPSKPSREDRQAEFSFSRQRIEDITSQAQTLHDKMKEYKDEFSIKVSSLKARQNALKSLKANLNTAKTTTIQTLEADTNSITQNAQLFYSTSVVPTRIEKLKEAASLAQLDQRPIKGPPPTSSTSSTASTPNSTKTPQQRHTYHIHGFPIPDLRHLNTHDPQTLTSSLASISRILLHAASYLSIRLPAEIILPHDSYPFPTIFTPASSYTPTRVPPRFINPYLHPPPGTGTPAYSPAELEKLHGPRARPLFVCQKPSELAREDPMGYALFVEGCALLAWNIAWLCRTQGFAVADKDWGELCALGRNLYWLLVIGPRSAARSSLGEGVRRADTTPTKEPQNDPPTQTYGIFTHASSHFFLRSNADAPISTSTTIPPPTIDTWKFLTFTPFRDRLKAHLSAELSGAEWEVLGSEEFEGFGLDGEGVGDADAREEEKRKSGWTKVKERKGESGV